MNRSNVGVTVLVAIVCIASVGMAAATLTTAETIGASDENPYIDPPDAQDVDLDDGDDRAAIDDPDNTTGAAEEIELLTRCVEPLDSTLGAGLVAIAFLGILGLIQFKFNFSVSLLAGWTLLPPIMLVYFLLTDCPGGGGGFGSGGASLDSAGNTVISIGVVPPWALGALVGAILIGAAVLVYRVTGQDEVVVPEEEEEDEPDLDQFAEAAGRAADRIEERNDDVDNSVYRAWMEMTTLLDVENPETYAAGEFAEEAIDLGMAEADVDELTTLFNEVRYGGKDAESREGRAVEILRTIESQYGSDEQDADDDASPDDRAGGERQ